MALQSIAWCDGCKDQQTVGPTFEVQISVRQILPRRDQQPDKTELILCGDGCYDDFKTALDNMIASQFNNRARPQIQITFPKERRTT